MSKIARVKFIRDKEPNIKALTAENKVLDGALYVATDTGTLWMGISSSSLIQIKDNINTNTTYNLTKSGNTITLRGSDGSTFNVTDSNTVYGNATASAAGLMSAADKAKLDGVAAGSNHVAVDAELSTTSTNPVQNKVIKSALDGKSNTGHKHVKADITDFPTSMPASDVPAWAKAATKPSYSKAEVGLGNVDNTADSAKSVKYAASAGSATTAATANALKVTELNTQNLDDIKTVGLYFAAGSNSVKNKPTDVDAFGLEVKRTASGYLVQVLTEGNANAMKTWIRQFNSSAWSAWAHYFDSNHTPTWSQVSNKPSFATVATSGSYNDLSNKPTIPTIPGSLKNPNALTISLNGTSQGAYDGSAVKNINITASSVGAAASSHTHTKAQITDFPTSMPASDVYSWAKQSSKPSYTISEVSGNLPASRISGTIAAANLPSYVDDVLEYASLSKFPTTGESGKIYTALDTNKIYRWSGSAYVVISETVALGTTHSSAGYGDESRAAYNHSTKTSGNPHHVTKTDVGLGNVDNTADSAKSVKYATSAGSAGSVAWSNVSGRPSSMPASDVYSWAKQPSKPSYTASEVGAAAASHSHNYAGADSAGGAANAVKDYGNVTANALRPIWFSNRDNDTLRVHNDNFKYNPEGNIVTCNISGTANYTKSLNGTARYVTQTSAAKPYWRCLKVESALDWIDESVVLCVDSGYEKGGFGILAVRFRNDQVSESAVATHGTVQWLCRYGFKPDQFILKIHSAKSTVGYADLYFRAIGTYNSCNIRILAKSTRGGNGSSWQLMDDEPRDAMDTRAYTAQATGYDVGNVAYASSAGAVAWGNISGKPSTYAPSSHTHDDRYYTESEMNTKLNAKAESDVITISSTKPTSNTCKLWIKI